MTLHLSISLLFIAAYTGYAFRDYRAAKHNTYVASETVNRLSNVFQSMQRIVREGGVDRCIILKAENGGKKKYGSVLMEVHNDNVDEVKSDFQRHRLDKKYMRLLEDVIERESVDVWTKDLDPREVLHTRYASDGIVAGWIFELETKDNVGVGHWLNWFRSKFTGQPYLFRRMYYLSCTTTDKLTPMFGDPVKKSVVLSEYSKIKNQIRLAVEAGVL